MPLSQNSQAWICNALCGILIRFPVESLSGLAWNIQSPLKKESKTDSIFILNRFGTNVPFHIEDPDMVRNPSDSSFRA